MKEMQSLTPDASSSAQDATNLLPIVWDRAITRFLKSAALVQALRGFENDMLVMNTDSETEDVKPALRQLQRDLSRVLDKEETKEIPLEDRKMEYVHLTSNATPVSPTQMNRSISAFIAQNRAKNNISNRNEFLRKRRRIVVESDSDGSGTLSMEMDLPTCARTDTVPVNRDIQMKYDIAKNEGGPLRRTIKLEPLDMQTQLKSQGPKGKGKAIVFDSIDDTVALQRHLGLQERFTNLEDHLSVRYVPSPPASLLDRVRFLEDHVIQLERDYPPWAALHFNQPNRGWPPPPRATPLVVPTHLTSSVDPPQEETTSNGETGPLTSGASRGGTKPRGKAKSSSLHRAVMQKLEIKKALAGED